MTWNESEVSPWYFDYWDSPSLSSQPTGINSMHHDIECDSASSQYRRDYYLSALLPFSFFLRNRRLFCFTFSPCFLRRVNVIKQILCYFFIIVAMWLLYNAHAFSSLFLLVTCFLGKNRCVVVAFHLSRVVLRTCEGWGVILLKEAYWREARYGGSRNSNVPEDGEVWARLFSGPEGCSVGGEGRIKWGREGWEFSKEASGSYLSQKAA